MRVDEPDVGGAEDIARAPIALPASETIDVLLFLVQLGERELLVADLLVQLSQALPALRHELDPLSAARVVVQPADPIGCRRVTGTGREHEHLTFVLADQSNDPVDETIERGRCKDRPAALPELHRSHPPQLTPHRDPVPRRLRG